MSDHPTHPLLRQIASADEMFTDLAFAAEEAVAAAGWEQPPTLWQVRATDTPPELLAAVPEDSTCSSFSLHRTTFLLEDPFADPFGELVGWAVDDPTCIGLVLVAEYLDETDDAADTGGAEARAAVILMRDGTEAMVRRFRHDPVAAAVPTSTEEAITGRLVWALRRALGMPSGVADTHAIPSFVGYHQRLVVADALGQLARLGAEHHDDIVAETAGSLSLMAQEGDGCWEEGRRLLLAEQEVLITRALRAGDTAATTAAIDKAVLLEWADGPLIARLFDDAVGDAEEFAVELWALVLSGFVSAETAARFGKVARLTPPAGEWGTVPPRRAACPCGSRVPFSRCHAPFLDDARVAG